MPPISGADNGGFAWMLTFRPRPENFTDQLVDTVTSFIKDKLEPDWHLIVKERGNHLHAAIFLHKPTQRGNLIHKFIGDTRVRTSNAPLQHWDDSEKKNFSRYDRERKTGAVINMTTLGLIAEYLSGEFDSKLGDDFEVISEHLPDASDISELEEYLPAVDGLKKKRQISVWYSQMEECYKEAVKSKLKIPVGVHGDGEKMYRCISEMRLVETTLVSLIQYRMWVVRDMDVIADDRIVQQRARALLGFIQQVAWGSYQDPARHTHEDGCLPSHWRDMGRTERRLWATDRCISCRRRVEDCRC